MSLVKKTGLNANVRKLSELMGIKNTKKLELCIKKVSVSFDDKIPESEISNILVDFYTQNPKDAKKLGLEELPNEIKLLISENLPTSSIIKLCKSSKRLKQICDDDRLWYSLLKKDFDADDIIFQDLHPKKTYATISEYFSYFENKHKLTRSKNSPDFDHLEHILQSLILTCGIRCLMKFLFFLENQSYTEKSFGLKEERQVLFHEKSVIRMAIKNMMFEMLQDKEYDIVKLFFKKDFFEKYYKELALSFIEKRISSQTDYKHFELLLVWVLIN